MKLHWILLFGFMTVSSVTVASELKSTFFEVCDPGQWSLTNVTVLWHNDTREIVGNISLQECTKCPIYTIHVISICLNRKNCLGEPTTWIERVNCESNDISDYDLEVCKIAEEVAKAETEKRVLTLRYRNPFVNYFFYNLCIDIYNDEYSGDLYDVGESSESSESDGGSKDGGSKDGGSKDGGSKDGGSKDGGSKDKGSKEGSKNKSG